MASSWLLFRVTLALSSSACTTSFWASKKEQSNSIRISDFLKLLPALTGIEMTFAEISLDNVAYSVAVTKMRVVLSSADIPNDVRRKKQNVANDILTLFIYLLS